MILGVAALSRCLAQGERKLLLLGEEQLQLAQEGVKQRAGLYGRSQAIVLISALPPLGEELGA